ncbi:MAG: GAF domain-containing protein [Microthrixaceae bacterium]
MDDRATWLARTMVELADTLVDDFDMMMLFSTLVERCAELVGDAEVGLVLDDQRGNLRPVASTTERMGLLELFEIQSEDGPCQDAYRTGRGVANRLLDERAEEDWPVFTPRARELGFRMVHAVPMRCRKQVVGAINVFQEVPNQLNDEDVHLLQAMADTATIALLQDRAVARASELAAQLQLALSTRIVIEQAKGVLAEREAIGVDAAFGRLRSIATARRLRLEEVAAEVVEGDLSG